ncbi:MAG: hypothetical protein N2109_05765 [Fimbriimonadales bacterium]|nr:hypothetical protein [Fimbriimonadales bacterium]
MTGRILSRWILSLAGLVCATVAWAFDARAVGPTVYVNELPVLTLRTRAGGAPAARAAQAAVKLRSLGVGAVTVAAGKRSAQVLIGGRQALNVKPQEAKAAGLSPKALAEQWAGNLRRALALPPLLVEPSVVRLGPDGRATVSLLGSKARTAALLGQGLPVMVSRSPGAIHLAARAEGEGTLIVSSGGESVSVAVTVLPYAAVFPQRVSAWVSGSPATREVVRGAVEAALRKRLVAREGARLAWGAFDVPSVPAGQRAAARVRVSAWAPDSVENSGLVEVEVVNLGLGVLREAELWYCNDPENLVGPGRLFSESLAVAKPVRLLFHHSNQSPVPLVLEVSIQNDSDLEARLAIIPGDSRPDPNPVLAGLRAGDEFLRNWLTGSAEVVAVPPRSRVPIALRRLAPRDTASGLQAIRLLPGGPGSVRLLASARLPMEYEGLAFQWSEAPWRFLPPLRTEPDDGRPGPSSQHVYPTPFRKESVVYRTGGRHAFVRIGQRPIDRADGQGALLGNFGVVYRIEAEALNEDSVPKEVEVVFEASAGYSGALFVVDNQYVRTPLLQPKQEFRLVRTRLEPRRSRRFAILTLPLSGSSYPATLVIREVDRLSAAR